MRLLEPSIARLGSKATLDEPRLLVLSSLFPTPKRPVAGVFVRERMSRVAAALPAIVVSPQPWFPFQSLVRLVRPHFRPSAPAEEQQGSLLILRPRFLCFPGILKGLDGFLMAIGSYLAVRRLKSTFRFDVIDAHFAYPDGYAATLLGKWLDVPVTITMRGTEVPLSRFRGRRRRITEALRRAARVFAVSASLRDHAVRLGVPSGSIRVVPNGVDLDKFRREDREQARGRLGIASDARVLISVGGLSARKGFHRVIDCLPNLMARFPSLRYLVVGGPGPEGDMTVELNRQIQRLGLGKVVTLLGEVPPVDLRWWLSAADVFVLATRHEGWANVFLEAMACGLPVVTTDVGGNREIIRRPEHGIVVPFGDEAALARALAEALDRDWDRGFIVTYAKENSWDDRVEALVTEFSQLREHHGV
jgi:glycosyltransferase involved in cell wall biosynthesis